MRERDDAFNRGLASESIDATPEDFDRAQTALAFAGLYASSNPRKRGLRSSGIMPSGERHVPTCHPSSPIAHLTGIGLVVANNAEKSGASSR